MNEILSPNQRAWRRFTQNRPAYFSLWLMLGLLMVVALWPFASSPAVSKFLPQAVSYQSDHFAGKQYEPPGLTHWCGTDGHGRDLLARMMYGARTSLLVGAVGAAVALFIGVIWGALAGYVGGRLDSVLMRIVDILYSLPSIIFVIVLVTALESTIKAWLAGNAGAGLAQQVRLFLLFAGLGAVSWLTMARIVRGQVLSLRHRQFVDASKALGASHARILWYHILPNTTGIIITYLTLTIPSVILYESFLSYLGLGIQPPMASWGSLIADGAAQLNPIRIYWWLLVCPAGMMVTSLLTLNFIGDGLRDAFDPRKDIS